MKKHAIAGLLLLVGLSTPAFADEKYFLVIDTVGNCSVFQGEPSAGMVAFGEKGGYEKKEDAVAALNAAREDPKAGCQGVVE